MFVCFAFVYTLAVEAYRGGDQGGLEFSGDNEDIFVVELKRSLQHFVALTWIHHVFLVSSIEFGISSNILVYQL